MMRSLYAGVSGLKTHQTKMDVIGNNIANVNTTAYKTKTITFSDMLYQTTQAATGPNTETERAGTNPRQIGLGVKTSAISTSITQEGASQTTGNPFDLKISGEAFFVVSNGTETFFTRDGSFSVDAAGYLAMSGTGYNVLGWTTTDPATGKIVQDIAKPIRIMGAANESFDAEATSNAYVYGILDEFDSNLQTTDGKKINLQIFDKLGYEYNLKFGVKPVVGTVQSTKTVTNTERLYELPDSIELIDNSKLTFNRSDGIEITKTNTPNELLAAIEEMARAEYENANFTSPVTLNVADVLAAYPDVDTALGTQSEWRKTGLEVEIAFSGETTYAAYDINGNSLGTLNVAADVLELFYTGIQGATLGSGPVTLSADFANGFLVKQSTYTDGTDPQYTFMKTDADRTQMTTIGYDDISKLLAIDASPDVQSQYTSVENTVTTEEIDGMYEVTLLSMTDSNMKEVDLSDFPEGSLTYALGYNTSDGQFSYVGTAGSNDITINFSMLGDNFEDLTIDFSQTKNLDNEGKATLEAAKGDTKGLNSGRKVGEMTGVSIGTDGTITASYSNGQSRILGQICVATFANAMGLANAGDNLYQETPNSGEFDGVGSDITADGTGYLTTGQLEMSNVDLSAEFTEMITTQRGFQANSRIITVSDTLLEELVNLKR